MGAFARGFAVIRAMCFFVAFVLCGLPAAVANAPAPFFASVQAVRIGTYDDFTRMMLRTNIPVRPKLFILENPHRLVIDLPQIGWEIPRPSGRVESRLVKDFRFGIISPGVSRVIFSLAGPAQIAQFDTMRAEDGNGYVLDIRLKEGRSQPVTAGISRIGKPAVAYGNARPAPTVDKVTRQAFRKRQFDPGNAEYDALGALLAGLDDTVQKPDAAPEAKAKAKAEAKKPEAPKQLQTLALATKIAPPALKPPRSPRVVEKPEPTEPESGIDTLAAALGARLNKAVPETPRRRPLRIVIDPGHGGHDPGTGEHVKHREADLVLAFTNTLLELLQSDPNYVSFATRTTDTFVALPDRVSFARDKRADLFISIHADWFDDPSVGGAGTYMLSEEASIRSTEKFVNKREGKVAGIDLDGEREDVVRVLLDLSRRETQIGSRRFAELVRGSLAEVTPLKRNFVRHNSFHVLKAPDMPSILLELGFMSNAADLKRLTSPKWRRTTAAALKEAIDAWRVERFARDFASR